MYPSRVICFIITLFILTTTTSAQKVSVSDLAHLFDKEMSGELTYLDYQSNEEVSIPVKCTISRKGDNAVDFAFQYPGEESANNVNTVKISADGGSFNNEDVFARQEVGGDVIISTRSNGKDDGKKVEFITTYTFSPDGYTSRKQVKFKDGSKLVRNRFDLKITDN